MSSEDASPPVDGEPSPSKANNPPEKSPSKANNPPEKSPAAEAPPAETDQAAPSKPAPEAEAAQPPPSPAVAGATPAVPAAGVNPAVPGPPGAAAAVAMAPPPPARRRAAPTRARSGESTDPRMVIGVVAGAVLLILFMVALVCCACCSKRRRKKKMSEQYHYGGHDQMHYFSNSGPNGGGHFYTNHPSSHHHKSKWHSPDHIVHIPPPMGVPWGEPFSPQKGHFTSPHKGHHTGGGGGGGGTHSADMGSNMSSPRSHHVPPPPPQTLGFSQNSFTYDELASATSGFAHANLLGQGGFGYVHKGVLPNGMEIAVKSLKSGSGQGEREFQAEVDIISRVHHRHLVSLVGYCIAGGQRMLVYEFVPNNNLEFHLHGKGRPPLEWGMRMKIAMGSAKGLAYLHEDCPHRIIHRDIKTANILLDHSFEAKVADFGLAKLTSDNNTHVSTRIMGTFGYLAPEYASSGKLTEKSDVYSFGVMMLELITGRRPIDMTGQMDESLVEWARPLLQRSLEDNNYDPFADPNLQHKYPPHEMRRMVACASSCVRHSGRRRPKMSEIVRALEGDVSLEDLNDGVKPGQSTAFPSTSGDETGTTTTGTYSSSQMRRFRQAALETNEYYSSSEFGATSEYGLNPSISTDSGESREESSINQPAKHSVA